MEPEDCTFKIIAQWQAVPVSKTTAFKPQVFGFLKNDELLRLPHNRSQLVSQFAIASKWHNLADE